MSEAGMISCLSLAVVLCASIGNAQTHEFGDGEYWYSIYRSNVSPVVPNTEAGELTVTGSNWQLVGKFTEFPGGDINESIAISSLTYLPNNYFHAGGTFQDGGSFDATIAYVGSAGAEVDQAPGREDEPGLVFLVPKAEGPTINDVIGTFGTISFNTDPTPNVNDGEPTAWVDVAVLTHTAASGNDFNGTREVRYGDWRGGGPMNYTATLDPVDATVTSNAGGDPMVTRLGVGGTATRTLTPFSGDPDDDELGMSITMPISPDRPLADAVGTYAFQGLRVQPNLSEWETEWGLLTIEADGTFYIGTEDTSGDVTPYGPVGTVSIDADGFLTFQNLSGGDPAKAMLSTDGNYLVVGDYSASDSIGLGVATRVPEPASLALIGLSGLMLVRRRV